MTMPETEATKKCPHCAEIIKAEANVCRFCGRDLNAPVAVPVTIVPQKSASGILFLLIIGALILSCIAFFVVSNLRTASGPPTPTTNPRQMAWTACTQFVKKQLGVSSSDAQKYTSSGVDVLADGLYDVSVYYANQASTYKCSLLRHTNGDWELLSLGVK